ncbi:MAG: helix-turn-helix domain-containing protein [Thermomicrobiales bacterium]
MADATQDDFLTVPETAELLKVSAVTVSRWLKDGRLPAYKVGPRAVRIRRVDLDQLLVPAATEGAKNLGSSRPGDSAQQAASAGQMGSHETTDEQWAVLEEMAALRDRIGTRRKGQSFASASDDLTKARQKRRKRL